MQAVLALHSSEAVTEFPCSSVITIGRDKNSDIVLNDPLVSRSHAMVRRLSDEDYYLVDGGSSNGSYINGRRISTPTRLSNGDTINIASVEFSFKQNTENKFPFNLNPAQDTLVMSSLDIKQITILVADIRGFTSFSEKAPIKLLTKLMSKWFYHVNECIIANGGTVDRFLGDCVYARWEADDDATQSIRNALRSACLINRISEKLREVYLKSKLPFKIGVGINTGHAAVMGGIGQDYTAIGDAVNIAFRLEKCTKRYKTDIILSHSSYQHLPKQCWADKAQQTKLRGKKEPVQICAFSFAQAQSIVRRISAKSN